MTRRITHRAMTVRSMLHMGRLLMAACAVTPVTWSTVTPCDSPAQLIPFQRQLLQAIDPCTSCRVRRSWKVHVHFEFCRGNLSLLAPTSSSYPPGPYSHRQNIIISNVFRDGHSHTLMSRPHQLLTVLPAPADRMWMSSGQPNHEPPLASYSRVIQRRDYSAVQRVPQQSIACRPKLLQPLS